MKNAPVIFFGGLVRCSYVKAHRWMFQSDTESLNNDSLWYVWCKTNDILKFSA